MNKYIKGSRVKLMEDSKAVGSPNSKLALVQEW